MKPNEYLEAVLRSQTLNEDGPELKALTDERKRVEALLREKFGAAPVIRYGGSRVKGTMILESYDLDILCYFPADDSSAGESLKDIFYNVKKALEAGYAVDERNSALRLKNKDPKNFGIYFHIDVVPGRFVDGKSGDAYLFQASADKDRLKTNPDMHIEHVQKSGLANVVRLVKLWKFRRGLQIRTFVLELLVIKILAGSKNKNDYAGLLKTFWEELKTNSQSLTVEDPANPEGNDLSGFLGVIEKAALATSATIALSQASSDKWQDIFGPTERPGDEDEANSLRVVVAESKKELPKPWST